MERFKTFTEQLDEAKVGDTCSCCDNKISDKGKCGCGPDCEHCGGQPDMNEAAPKINKGKAKGSISATGLRGKGFKKYDVDVKVDNGKFTFRITDETGKFQTVGIKQAAKMLGEEVVMDAIDVLDEAKFGSEYGYKITHEKGKKGHRAVMKNKDGKVSYMGGTSYKKPEHAKGEAQAYHDAYFNSPAIKNNDRGAERAVADYRKKNKQHMHEEEINISMSELNELSAEEKKLVNQMYDKKGNLTPLGKKVMNHGKKPGDKGYVENTNEEVELDEDRRAELYHQSMMFTHAMKQAEFKKKDPRLAKQHDVAGKLHAKAADMHVDNHSDAKKHSDKANKASTLLGEEAELDEDTINNVTAAYINENNISMAELENMTEEELNELIGKAIGGAFKLGAKAAVGAGRMAKKAVNRVSASGRADAAEKKAAAIEKRNADRERIKKAQQRVRDAKQAARNR